MTTNEKYPLSKELMESGVNLDALRAIGARGASARGSRKREGESLIGEASPAKKLKLQSDEDLTQEEQKQQDYQKTLEKAAQIEGYNIIANAVLNYRKRKVSVEEKFIEVMKLTGVCIHLHIIGLVGGYVCTKFQKFMARHPNFRSGNQALNQFIPQIFQNLTTKYTTEYSEKIQHIYKYMNAMYKICVIAKLTREDGILKREIRKILTEPMQYFILEHFSSDLVEKVVVPIDNINLITLNKVSIIFLNCLEYLETHYIPKMNSNTTLYQNILNISLFKEPYIIQQLSNLNWTLHALQPKRYCTQTAEELRAQFGKITNLVKGRSQTTVKKVGSIFDV